MIKTIQAFVFLHQLKEVQQSELGTIFIDPQLKEMKTAYDDGNNLGSEPTVINLENKWSSVDAMTDYLVELGLLEKIRMSYYYLNHKGYHYIQTSLFDLLDMLLKSVVLPVIVAIITTIITLWINGQIPLNNP